MRRATVTVLVLAVTLAGARAGQPGPDKKRKPQFTVGKETTYLTGPLDKDGYVDYVAALNKRLGEGVTAENNANVLLWRAYGPQPQGAEVPPAFFEALGMAPPAPKGAYYYVGLFKYLVGTLNVGLQKAEDDSLALLGRTTQGPWTAKEYPEAAGWLKHNDKALTLVVEASQRPRYFAPLVPTGKAAEAPAVLSAPVYSAARDRDVASALVARAMLHAGEGRGAEAWADLLACHRLGRLLARGPRYLEYLTGLAVSQLAAEADLRFLDAAKPDAKQLRQWLQDLGKLPPLPSPADTLDLGERFTALDCVMFLDRHGSEGLRRLVGKPPEGKKPPEDIHWDPALRGLTKMYDRVSAALRLADRASRAKELAQIDKELKELHDKLRDPEFLTNALVGPKSTPDTRGQALGDMLVGLVVPAFTRVQQAADRAEQTHRNLVVAYALALYRSENGQYPAKLDALSPKYLPNVPDDLFSGKALIYRPDAKGYLLYSVGPNGKDDQGRTFEDDPPGDDLRVRMPLPPLPGKKPRP
jgi:hypothetical protein